MSRRIKGSKEKKKAHTPTQKLNLLTYDLNSKFQIANEPLYINALGALKRSQNHLKLVLPKMVPIRRLLKHNLTVVTLFYLVYKYAKSFHGETRFSKLRLSKYFTKITS